MPKIAHLEADHAANAATSGTDKLIKVATQTTERAADATGELQQKTLRRSAQGTTKLGQLFMTLFVEQARYNLQLYLEIFQGLTNSKAPTAGTQVQRTA